MMFAFLKRFCTGFLFFCRFVWVGVFWFYRQLGGIDFPPFFVSICKMTSPEKCETHQIKYG